MPRSFSDGTELSLQLDGQLSETSGATIPRSVFGRAEAEGLSKPDSNRNNEEETTTIKKHPSVRPAC